MGAKGGRKGAESGGGVNACILATFLLLTIGFVLGGKEMMERRLG